MFDELVCFTMKVTIERIEFTKAVENGRKVRVGHDVNSERVFGLIDKVREVSNVIRISEMGA